MHVTHSSLTTTRLFDMLSRLFSRAFSSSSSQLSMAAKDLIESALNENKVVVFSKSYCPYCHATKSLFNDNFSSVPMKVYEYAALLKKRCLKTQDFTLRLDMLDEGSAIQSYLAEKTGQRTVPSVFISACLDLLCSAYLLTGSNFHQTSDTLEETAMPRPPSRAVNSHNL